MYYHMQLDLKLVSRSVNLSEETNIVAPGFYSPTDLTFRKCFSKCQMQLQFIHRHFSGLITVYISYNLFSDPGPSLEIIYLAGPISYAASCHSYEIDMKTLDTKDEI